MIKNPMVAVPKHATLRILDACLVVTRISLTQVFHDLLVLIVFAPVVLLLCLVLDDGVDTLKALLHRLCCIIELT